MNETKVMIRQHYTVGEISPRLFGSFVEHMGSVVYNGIYEPGHPKADENGFRLDVLETGEKSGFRSYSISRRQLYFGL